jgi:hypothetical protein
MLLNQFKAAARMGLEAINKYSRESREALALTRLENKTVPTAVEPLDAHLDAAIEWIKRAQDSSATGGVAWGYRARRPVRTNLPMGWIGPYPETTGYIIPTMLRYADLRSDSDALKRAKRMAEWEMSIQLPDGGIQGGVYGETPVASSTFVTGQVIFGLVALYERTHDERIRTAAIAAGEWVLSCLDDSGRFVRGHSHFCAPGAKVYEVRTGLALAELGDALGEPKYKDAASKTADFAISRQHSNGWFAENDLDFHKQPLTHTIGYTLEGLHGLGKRLRRQDCLDAVRRTLDALTGHIHDNGYLAGRLCADWSPAVDWVCLTGSAQLAGVFMRVYAETRKREYLEAGRKLLGFVCFTQDLKTGIPGLDGGVRGSFPLSGGYGQWCVLNWATKFFSDSMLEYLEIKRTIHQDGAHPQ